MKIGIYAPNWVGDAVMSFPFISSCRRRHRDEEIVIVARPWVSAVFESHPLINEVVVLNTGSSAVATTREGLRLRDLDLDRFYLLSDSWRSAYLARLSGAPDRVGFAAQWRSFLLTTAVKPSRTKMHRSERCLALLSGAYDLGEDSTGIHLRKEEREWARGEIQSLGMTSPIAVFPSSVAESRRVPVEKWQAILSLARGSGAELLLFGSAADKETGSELSHRVDGDNVRSVCGVYSLRQSVALISKCAGAIGTDSGLSHVAANLGLKTVTIFGAGDPAQTVPLGSRTTVITESVHCSPCRRNVCRNEDEPLICLTSLEADRIWQTYLSQK